MREQPDTTKKKKASGKATGKPAKKPSAKSAVQETLPEEKTPRGRKQKAPPAPVYEPDMVSRIAGGIVCVILMALVLLGIVQPGGAVPDFFCKLLRGLTGNGFWASAPAFMMASYCLFFVKDRPVWGRLTALFLLPIIFGALLHIILVLPGMYSMESGSLKQLWFDGQGLASGGLFGGFLAVSFISWFGRGGGGGALFILFLLLIAVIFHITPARISRLASHMYEKDFYDDPYDEPEEYEPQRNPKNRRRAEMPPEKGPVEDYDYGLPPVQEHYVPPYRGPRPAEGQGNTVLDKVNGILNATKNSIFGGRQQDKVADWGEHFGGNPEDTVVPREKPQQTPDDTQPEQQSGQPAPADDNDELQQDIPEEPAAFIPEREDDRADVFAAYRGESYESGQKLLSAVKPVAPEKPASKAAPAAEPEPEPYKDSGFVEEPDYGMELYPEEEPPCEPEEPPAPPPEPPAPAPKPAQEPPVIRNPEELPPEYSRPGTELLTPPSGEMKGAIEEKENTLKRLDNVLASFGIDGHMVGAVQGPSVTRYEMELSQGVRLSKVTNLADDLALALGVSSVRVAPVPGKIAIVGIEVPNKVVTAVPIREVIESAAFRKHKSQVAFSVGKDIGGNYIVGDCAKLPHMLIAGTTGSGKSVCINSLLISLLFKSSPEEVRLIMVDPKMVELGIYNGIPHLLIPVVTDPKKAAGALQWSVTEMMRRYKTMSENGVRKIDEYNEKMEREGGQREPMIVVVIDELADLMMVAAKEVEDSICRVAQMGRAAGIHLVIATQRPSADVITGLMKANIPSRIAFAVASSLESRIILDNTGAEKLVGKGDMLWAPLGSGKPLRVQGCFISDEEVAAVVDEIKRNNAEAQYDESVSAQAEQNAAAVGAGKKGAKGAPAAAGGGIYDAGIVPGGDDEELDEMFGAAVEVVLDVGQASVSMLQRRLKLGFARAARVMDQLEEQGVVGPNEGAKSRQVLLTREQWEIQKAGGVPEDMEAIPGTEEPLE